MGAYPNFPNTPVHFGVKIQAADLTDIKDFIESPEGGCLIGVIRASSDNGTPITLRFFRRIGEEDFPLEEVIIPAGAGSGGVPFVDVLDKINQSEAMSFPSLGKLRVRAMAPVANEKTIYLVAEGGQF
ncbi:MAG: hypothetical protein HY795_04480 [Desulfovibrio sp.]|nr:hypothetical protein [Desulfovibrio sp.]MBI4960428.1 hypothetical protein [Desulfovibrio sp.]